MENVILFNPFNSAAGLLAAKNLSKTFVAAQLPLVLRTTFLDYGDSYLNQVTTQRIIQKYN